LSEAAGHESSLELLGERIFFDENLSLNRNQSCASCHGPNVGFTGPLSEINAHGAVYPGSVPRRFGNRRPPTAAYATVSPVLHREVEEGEVLFVGGNFWDGRATGEKLGNPAADQAQGPFTNPLEQALGSPAIVVRRVCNGPYGRLFRIVSGEALCRPDHQEQAFNKIALAVAAYENSPEVNSFTSRFDAVLAGRAEFTPREKRGLDLFKGKGGCAACHTLDGQRPLFTDFTFDNLGVPRNPENPWYNMMEFNPQGRAWVDEGLGGFLKTRPDYALYAAENLGKQKVPTLRNVDRRPSPQFVKSYMHNGYFKTLEGVVNFYNTRDVKPACPDPFTTEADALARGCWPAPEVAATVNREELGNLGLSRDEERAIVAFLETLNDGFGVGTGRD
jgi:cytochrome c peroxidase